METTGSQRDNHTHNLFFFKSLVVINLCAQQECGLERGSSYWGPHRLFHRACGLSRVQVKFSESGCCGLSIHILPELQQKPFFMISAHTRN